LRIIGKEERDFFHKDTKISLRCVRKIGNSVDIVLFLAIVEEKDYRADNSGQVEYIQHIEINLVTRCSLVVTGKLGENVVFAELNIISDLTIGREQIGNQVVAVRKQETKD
jgi:hypothetical protein